MCLFLLLREEEKSNIFKLMLQHLPILGPFGVKSTLEAVLKGFKDVSTKTGVSHPNAKEYFETYFSNCSNLLDFIHLDYCTVLYFVNFVEDFQDFPSRENFAKIELSQFLFDKRLTLYC